MSFFHFNHRIHTVLCVYNATIFTVLTAGSVYALIIMTANSIAIPEMFPQFSLVTRFPGWLRGTVVERWSLVGELSLSCARPAAEG